MLQVISKHIRQYIPMENVVASWGGEEFVILLPNGSLAEAFAKVEIRHEKLST
jgi:diguanylate cyclase